MEKKRFYIDTRANDDEAYHLAIQAACELANQDDDIKKVVLLIHTKQNTGWFERLYGSDTVKKLFTGTRFKNCKPLFKFETTRTYNDTYTPAEVVITCGLNAEEVSKIDNYYAVKAIISIPWLPEDLQKWVQTWSPIELRGKQAAVTAFPEPSCIVIKALEALSESINTSTGITHPSDERLAKTYIRSLHKYEPLLDADIVGAYLVSKLGWDTAYAKEVEKLITTLNNGKFFQGGEKTGLQHYYKRWKEECGS